MHKDDEPAHALKETEQCEARGDFFNAEERQAATVLFQALTKAKGALLAGERDGERLRQIMAETIQTEPLARMQYVSCADSSTLAELEQVKDQALLSMAVFIGKTRLIDNMLVQI